MHRLMMMVSMAVLSLTVSLSVYATDLKCFGTEPFWSLQVSSSGFTFKSLDKTKYTMSAVKPQKARGFQQSALRIYKTKTASSKPATIIIQKQKCSDNMSDNTYPYTVIFMTGNENYYGCCRK